MTKRDPVFLAGVDRSGIGLLGELLESHPNISVTRRINFWSFYYERYGDLSQPENFERCMTDMMRYTRIQRMQPQLERIRHEFQSGEQSYARLFALLQEHYMQRLGKLRWADKSLGSERYADIILPAYPGAKMVHIIRDPRDRYASQLSHRGVGKGKVGAGTALWLWSTRLAESHIRKYPDRYKVVRYETLVAEPEIFLRDLCDFIGEEYSPEMLMIGELDQGESGLNSAITRKPRYIWSTSNGRFREILSEREVAFLQTFTRGKMSRYDYYPEPLHLSWSSRLLFYLIDCPVNLTRMLFSHPMATIRHKVGKAPSERRLATAP